MMLIRYVLLPLLSALPLPAVAADFFAGMDAMDRHDGPAALREFKPLALAGEADAENELGLVLERGEGLPANPAEAVTWFRRAADHGLLAGLVNLGRAFDAGTGVGKDPVEAVRLYAKAANRGSLQAMMLLGAAYDRGTGVPADRIAARSWCLKAAQAGLVPGMFEAARLLLSSTDPAEKAQGREWLQKAADNGYVPAQALLGIAKLVGQGGFAPDPVAGAAMVRIAADRGDADAAGALGAAYHGGLGVPMSETEAIAWTERAARLGNLQAQVGTARSRLAAHDPQAAFFWASVAVRAAPPASGADAILAEAGRQLTPAQQTEQRQRAAAWHPGQPS